MYHHFISTKLIVPQHLKATPSRHCFPFHVFFYPLLVPLPFFAAAAAARTDNDELSLYNVFSDEGFMCFPYVE